MNFILFCCFYLFCFLFVEFEENPQFEHGMKTKIFLFIEKNMKSDKDERRRNVRNGDSS